MDKVLDEEVKKSNVFSTKDIEHGVTNVYDSYSTFSSSMDDIKDNLKEIDNKVDSLLNQEISRLNNKCDNLEAELKLKNRFIESILGIYDKSNSTSILLAIIAAICGLRLFLDPFEETVMTGVVLLIILFILFPIIYFTNKKFIKNTRSAFTEGIDNFLYGGKDEKKS